MADKTDSLVKSKLARDPLLAANSQVVMHLVDDNDDFAFDLYQQQARGQDGNLFFSPYSLSAALAMLYAGARGETAAQMAQTLHFTLRQDVLHAACNALDLQLNSPTSNTLVEDLGRIPLQTASALWAQRDYPFLPAFLDVLGRNYGAGVRLVDYTDEASRELARQAINAWVSRETREKIKALIGRGMLDSLTRLVLCNAIYFEGAWSTPFKHESPLAPFYKLDGRQAQAHLMYRHKKETGYARTPDCEVVELPYADGRTTFILLLPPAGQFTAFEQSLTAGKLRSILVKTHREDVQLYLPRFTFDSSLALAGALSALGMPLAFDAARADFSGASSAQPPLVLSDVIHKAFVAVDEKGTVAAAATSWTAVAGAAKHPVPKPPIVVRVDHPFIFLIQERRTGSILFMGRLMDPISG